MAQITIPLAYPPGVNSDDTAFAASGRTASANYVRWYQGRPETIGERAFIAPSTDDRPVRGLFIRNSGSPGTYIAQTVYAYQRNVAYSDDFGTISADQITALTFDAYHWSFGCWGSETLMSPRGGSLYTLGTAAEIANAPDEINCILIHPKVRQVLAFGCNEETSGTFNALCIRWCDFEDYTDWTTTASNNAGELILDGGGECVAARLVGDYILLWTTSTLFIGTFVGDPGQTWRFDRVEGGIGCHGQDAVTVVDGVAYWLAPNLSFWRYALGGQPSILPCTISRDFQANIDQASTKPVRAMASRKRGDVFWFYSDARDSSDYNTRWVCYQINESLAAQRPVWTQGTQYVSASGIQGASAAVDSPEALAVLSASFGVDSPDGIQARFSLGSSIITETVVMSSTESTPGAWHVEGADQYLDKGRRRVHLKRFVPDFEEQSGDITLSVSFRDRPRSTASTSTYTIAAADTKKDLRKSGMLGAIKLSGSAGKMRMGEPTFDGVTMGER